ncbi:MAG TPA: hypothetical protein VFJ22_00870 [Dermatophilaceae bacterium]|nr:hypothetical protein [Dermatophilaceae bacterium]
MRSASTGPASRRGTWAEDAGLVGSVAACAAGSAVLQPGSRPRWVIAEGLERPMLAAREWTS